MGGGGGAGGGHFYIFVFSGSVAPHSFLCAEAQELINGLLQRPDARAGLQISASMCLLFDGWCFNILDLNGGRSAWWAPSHGYSGAQPGAPERDDGGDWERRGQKTTSSSSSF